MRLSELHALDFSALWEGLTLAQQAEIGTAALTQEFAILVQEDDGSETTADDCLEASDTAHKAHNALPRIIQACFPDVVWFEPAVGTLSDHEEHIYDSAA